MEILSKKLVLSFDFLPDSERVPLAEDKTFVLDIILSPEDERDFDLFLAHRIPYLWEHKHLWNNGRSCEEDDLLQHLFKWLHSTEIEYEKNCPENRGNSYHKAASSIKRCLESPLEMSATKDIIASFVESLEDSRSAIIMGEGKAWTNEAESFRGTKRIINNPENIWEVLGQSDINNYMCSVYQHLLVFIALNVIDAFFLRGMPTRIILNSGYLHLLYFRNVNLPVDPSPGTTIAPSKVHNFFEEVLYEDLMRVIRKVVDYLFPEIIDDIPEFYSSRFKFSLSPYERFFSEDLQFSLRKKSLVERLRDIGKKKTLFNPGYGGIFARNDFFTFFTSLRDFKRSLSNESYFKDLKIIFESAKLDLSEYRGHVYTDTSISKGMRKMHVFDHWIGLCFVPHIISKSLPFDLFCNIFPGYFFLKYKDIRFDCFEAATIKVIAILAILNRDGREVPTDEDLSVRKLLKKILLGEKITKSDIYKYTTETFIISGFNVRERLLILLSKIGKYSIRPFAAGLLCKHVLIRRMILEDDYCDAVIRSKMVCRLVHRLVRQNDPV